VDNDSGNHVLKLNNIFLILIMQSSVLYFGEIYVSNKLIYIIILIRYCLEGNMEYRKLGNTNLNVSLICLGTMSFGEQNTEKDAHEQLTYAIDHGVNFIDTAEMYAIPPKEETQGLKEKFKQR
jgi:hypothetical protein